MSSPKDYQFIYRTSREQKIVEKCEDLFTGLEQAITKVTDLKSKFQNQKGVLYTSPVKSVQNQPINSHSQPSHSPIIINNGNQRLNISPFSNQTKSISDDLNRETILSSKSQAVYASISPEQSSVVGYTNSQTSVRVQEYIRELQTKLLLFTKTLDQRDKDIQTLKITNESYQDKLVRQQDKINSLKKERSLSDQECCEWKKKYFDKLKEIHSLKTQIHLEYENKNKEIIDSYEEIIGQYNQDVDELQMKLNESQKQLFYVKQTSLKQIHNDSNDQEKYKIIQDLQRSQQENELLNKKLIQRSEQIQDLQGQITEMEVKIFNFEQLSNSKGEIITLKEQNHQLNIKLQEKREIQSNLKWNHQVHLQENQQLLLNNNYYISLKDELSEKQEIISNQNQQIQDLQSQIGTIHKEFIEVYNNYNLSSQSYEDNQSEDIKSIALSIKSLINNLYQEKSSIQKNINKYRFQKAFLLIKQDNKSRVTFKNKVAQNQIVQELQQKLQDHSQLLTENQQIHFNQVSQIKQIYQSQMTSLQEKIDNQSQTIRNFDGQLLNQNQLIDELQKQIQSYQYEILKQQNNEESQKQKETLCILRDQIINASEPYMENNKTESQQLEITELFNQFLKSINEHKQKMRVQLNSERVLRKLQSFSIEVLENYKNIAFEENIKKNSLIQKLKDCLLTKLQQLEENESKTNKIIKNLEKNVMESNSDQLKIKQNQIQNFQSRNQELLKQIKQLNDELYQTLEKYDDLSKQNDELQDKIQEMKRSLNCKDLDFEQLLKKLDDQKQEIQELQVYNDTLFEDNKRLKNLEQEQKNCEQCKKLEIQLNKFKENQSNQLNTQSVLIDQLERENEQLYHDLELTYRKLIARQSVNEYYIFGLEAQLEAQKQEIQNEQKIELEYIIDTQVLEIQNLNKKINEIQTQSDIKMNQLKTKQEQEILGLRIKYENVQMIHEDYLSLQAFRFLTRQTDQTNKLNSNVNIVSNNSVIQTPSNQEENFIHRRQISSVVNPIEMEQIQRRQSSFVYDVKKNLPKRKRTVIDIFKDQFVNQYNQNKQEQELQQLEKDYQEATIENKSLKRDMESLTLQVDTLKGIIQNFENQEDITKITENMKELENKTFTLQDTLKKMNAIRMILLHYHREKVKDLKSQIGQLENE